MVRRVGARIAGLAQGGEVRDNVTDVTVVHRVAVQQQNQLVEELENVATRLVDGAQDEQAALSAQLFERLGNTQSCAAVQARGGLVQKEDLCE